MNPETATRLLTHYIRLCAKAAGVNWQWDNDSEIAEIVDAILSEPRTQIAALESRLAALESRLATQDREISDAMDGAVAQGIDVHETQYHR